MNLMGAEDEFRKVAEDVRELARTLRHELRSAQRDARDAARSAGDDIRREFRSYQKGAYRGSYGKPPPHRHGRPGWYSGWTPPGVGQATAERPPRPPTPVYKPSPPKPVRPPRPPIRHRHDGSTLASLLLVIAGLAWLASQTHVFNVSAEAALAVALAILGAGMVITARTDWSLSRRAWPVWLGLLLLVILVGNASNVAGGLSSLSFGPVRSSPTTWAGAKGTIDNFAGPINVDLSQLTGAPPSDEKLTVHDTFGPVEVLLPSNPSYHIHITAHSVAGPVTLPNTGGGDGHGERVADVNPQGTPTLTLDLRTVAGPVTVK